MGGVDIADEVLKKTHKVQSEILTRFLYLFEVCANNAWRLFRMSRKNRTEVPFKTFLHAVVVIHCQKYNNPHKNYHDSSFVKSKRVCSFCKKGKTQNICLHCNQYLHQSCFSEFHNKQISNNLYTKYKNL